MASKWSTEPYGSTSHTSSLSNLARPASIASRESLLSLLNTSRTPSRGPNRAGESMEQVQKSGTSGQSTPASRDEGFVYAGRDSEEREVGEGGKLNGRNGSGRSSTGVQVSPPSSPATERLLSSPESTKSPAPPTPPVHYSKHEPPGYRYKSTSPTTSPRATLAAPPSPAPTSSPPAPLLEENLPRDREHLSTIRARAHRLAQDHAARSAEGRAAIPAGARLGQDALTQPRSLPPPQSPAPLPHMPIALIHHSPPPSPNASPTEKVFSLEKQLRSAQQDVARLRQQRNDLNDYVERVNQDAQQDRFALAHAEKAISSGRGEVEQLRVELARREEELEQARRKVEDSERLKREAVKEIVSLEDVSEVIVDRAVEDRHTVATFQEKIMMLEEHHLELERMIAVVEQEKDTIAAELARAKDQIREAAAAQQLMDVKLRMVERDRDGVNAELAETREALLEAKEQVKEVQHEVVCLRAEQRSLTAQAGTRQDDEAALRQSLDAAKREKEEVIARLDFVQSRLSRLESDYADALSREKEIKKERDELKEHHSARLAKFKHLWEKTKKENEEKVSELQATIKQLKKELEAAKEKGKSRAVEDYPRFVSPSALLDLAKSPQVNDAAFTGKLPLEISIEKPVREYPLETPARQLLTLNQAHLKLQTAHRSCSARHRTDESLITSLTRERDSAKMHLRETEKERDDAHRERDEVYGVLQELLEETKWMEEAPTNPPVLHPSSTSLSPAAAAANPSSRPSSSTSDISTPAAQFGTARAGSAFGFATGTGGTNALELDGVGAGGERGGYETEERRVERSMGAEEEEEL